ncbi:MAG TPA: rhomboid family intramembrane serine protease [Thermoanaerobaculia bacterium]|nr:rhomboid family intramembrane serine protease [Thermoanaerobaculia bacterium]
MIARPSKRTPGTAAVTIAILLGFVIEILSGAWNHPEILADLGAVGYYYIFGKGEYWRLLSAMFLHGDGTPGGTVLHLLVNLFSLFQLGTLYEIMFGTRRFLFIYFVCGILASLTTAMRPGVVSVGASGAIFGVMGAFVFSILRSPRWRHERAARGLVGQCVFWIIANIAIGMQISGIDNYAHIGGLLAGLALGAILPHRVPPPPPTRVIDVHPYEG